MKQILVLIAAVTFSAAAMAQSDKFNSAMSGKIAEIDSAKTADDFLASSAGFERIADAEKNQWLPYYYAAYTQALYALIKNDQPNNDQYADKVDALLAKADALAPNNSEISVIRSITATLRMLVDPMSRYQVYGPAIEKALGEAKTQDPSNPRPYFIQGQNLRYTPEQFGGGCGVAKPILEEAIKRYDAFKPASALHPHWGKKQASDLIAGCK
ncbi:hypothetical protein HHL16_06440 [Pseudoflavitalea sp. G-6-1-2]|uniref:hypothetical protein n=1 Tax=Pseudoflavitalea sp. G-6-1-2 TaxID=2728841 RepID=UPI001469AB87|nr:hypothetical protein [Pseudoflavitalea sp. G-6-1-2]NML20503.1 hypothetical protein [Pseudoflavitalea sp. G-6-1-2]